jgi:hypothetical protein
LTQRGENDSEDSAGKKPFNLSLSENGRFGKTPLGISHRLDNIFFWRMLIADWKLIRRLETPGIDQWATLCNIRVPG